MKFKKEFIYFNVAILCSSLSFISVISSPSANSHEILNNVFNAIANIKTLRYHLVLGERINGKIHYTESHVKLQIHPRKIYLSLKGREVLWIQGENNEDGLVNPDAFPYVNLNLDPYGTLLRKNQHHTIHDVGVAYIADIIKNAMLKVGNNFDKHFAIIGEEVYNGSHCYKLSISFPDFFWEPNI